MSEPVKEAPPVSTPKKSLRDVLGAKSFSPSPASSPVTPSDKKMNTNVNDYVPSPGGHQQFLNPSGYQAYSSPQHQQGYGGNYYSPQQGYWPPYVGMRPVPSMVPAAANIPVTPTIPVQTTGAAPHLNGVANGTSPSVAPSEPSKPAATATATTPVTTGTTPAATATSTTPAATATTPVATTTPNSNLSVPSSGDRSQLTSSTGEQQLQAPISKRKTAPQSATPTTATPETKEDSKKQEEKPSTDKPASAEKNNVTENSSDKAAKSNETSSTPSKTEQASEPAKTASGDKPVLNAPTPVKAVPLKESLDEINFKVKSPSPPPASTTPSSETKGAETKPKVVVPPPSSGAYRPPSARATEKSTSPAPAAASTATSGATPTAEDLKAAAQNESVARPPGVIAYSREQLLAYATLAKAGQSTAPPQIKQALALYGSVIDRRSPAGTTGGRGGSRGGKSGGKKEKSVKPTIAARPVVEAGSKEAKARMFRSILNKITPETFQKLIGSLLEIKIEDLETLVTLVDIIAENAFREIKFCAMYADLCAQISEDLPTFEVPEVGEQRFRHCMLRKCQTCFTQRHSIQPAPEEMTDPEERTEWDIRQIKLRGNTIVLIKFIGELANKKVLAIRVIQGCLADLWKDKTFYDDLELFCILLSTVGKVLSTKEEALVNQLIEECKEWIADFASKEKQDSDGTRIRYLMQDLVDLATNGWVVRNTAAAQGPKTLDEIKQDILAKEQKMQKELLRSSKGGSRAGTPRTPARGPTSVPRTPSSPMQGGRGKASFTQSGSPSRPAVSDMNLSNAFDSLSIKTDYNPNYMANSSSSVPDEEEAVDEGVLNEEEIDALVEEFLDAGEAGETADTLSEQPSLLASTKYFVYRLFMTTLEKNDLRMRTWSVEMLQSMARHPSLQDAEQTVVPGLTQVIESLEEIDLPKAPGYMGVMLADCLTSKAIPPSALNKILAPLKNDNPTRASNLILALWQHIPANVVGTLIKQADFNISQWPIKEEAIPAALKSSFDTPETMMKRGDDVSSVVAWTKTNQPHLLKQLDFVLNALYQILDQVQGEKVPDDKFGPTVEILLSNKNLHAELAAKVAGKYVKNMKVALAIFTWLKDKGLSVSVITKATEAHEEYLFYPPFNVWMTKVAPQVEKSSGKGGKSGKGKPKKK